MMVVNLSERSGGVHVCTAAHGLEPRRQDEQTQLPFEWRGLIFGEIDTGGMGMHCRDGKLAHDGPKNEPERDG